MARLSILMLSTDPRMLGGITALTAMVMKYAKNADFTLVPLGRLHAHEPPFATLWRLLRMPILIAWQARRAHAVHINIPFNSKGLVRDGLILLALRLTGCRRLLVYFHGWQLPLGDRIARHALLRRSMAWLLKHAGQIWVLSPAFKDQLVAMGMDERRITLTHTMFDGSEISSHPPPLPTTRRRIVFLSRLVREKGIYELLEAFDHIAPDYADVDLLLAGDGPEKASILQCIEKYAPQRVHYVGAVVGEAKAALLQSATIFALPTYAAEGMPIALLEAMGAGKPLLTSRAGGIAHWLSSPESGTMLHHVQCDTIEAALRQMLNDPAACQATGERNRTIAWQRFEARIVTAEIETYYQRIAAS